MGRLIASLNSGQLFVNIPGDRMENSEGIIYAFSGANLIGAFDMGFVDCIYITPDGKQGVNEDRNWGGLQIK